MRRFLAIAVGCLFTLAVAATAVADVEVTPDVVYGHKHGMALTFDVFTPDNANGAAVLNMVSGGFFSRWRPTAQSQRRYQPLLDRGFTVFAVRHGSSPKYNIPEIVPDVRRAVRFIRLHADDFDVDPNRLGVWGGSAGGHLALMLGTTSDAGAAAADDEVDRVSNRVAAVVAYFPAVDLRGVVRGADPADGGDQRFPALNFDRALAADFSPLVHVSADDPPTLLIHGDADELVPVSNSHIIHEAFQQHQVTSKVIVIEDAPHGFRGDNARRAMAALLDWFDKYLAEN